MGKNLRCRKDNTALGNTDLYALDFKADYKSIRASILIFLKITFFYFSEMLMRYSVSQKVAKYLS